MYKKLLLVFVSITSITTVKAQTEKGSQMLGVAFDVTTSNSNSKYFDYTTNTFGQNIGGKVTRFTVAPSYSYFIADKLDIGASVGYSHSQQNLDNNYGGTQYSNENAFTASIYLRKYFLYENKIGISTGPLLNYQASKLTQGNTGTALYGSANKSNLYSGGVGVDLVYFPVKRLGLTARLGGMNYTHQVVSGDAPATYNSFNLNFTNGFVFSVNYVFGN